MADLKPHEAFYYGGQVRGRAVETREELAAEFERRTVAYDEFFGRTLDDLRGLPAIDLACGYGNFLYHLRHRGWSDIRGVDLDGQQVALANSLDLPATRGDARSALDGDRRYGLVSAFDLIEHLDKDDAVGLLVRAKQALLPGGALIVQCPCADGFRGANDLCNDLTHKWAPTSVVLRQMLATAGFATVSVVDMSLPPFPRGARGRVKYAIRRAARRAVRPVLAVLGVNDPPVWSNSQIAVARTAASET